MNDNEEDRIPTISKNSLPSLVHPFSPSFIIVSLSSLVPDQSLQSLISTHLHHDLTSFDFSLSPSRSASILFICSTLSLICYASSSYLVLFCFGYILSFMIHSLVHRGIVFAFVFYHVALLRSRESGNGGRSNEGGKSTLPTLRLSFQVFQN
ncbi:hypothetical protein EV361DRAFT_339552 [Lentinula raphanica]|nr:hypothetical protein EV361DRAFT_339552 [Lentinula raphanica]